ncbi:MAG: Co2+/Mg2+ efflux protein ApaG [Planctomycetota bacterium]|nr:Co2+/Mg2+ efflux protein ApaG [Planctomycetota bacterium]
MTTATPPDRGSNVVSNGFRVEVRPEYLAEQSRPAQRKWVFAYRIRILNQSHRRARLRARHWIIVDADGERHDVVGEGVVGLQPTLNPGQQFEYSSYCPLETPWGTMEGSYTFEGDDGETFEVTVGRFFLVSSDA